MSSRRRQKDQRKYERERRQHDLDGLRHQLQRGPLAGTPVVVNPAGEAKMSEVLEAFAEPYVGITTTDDDLRKIYAVATVAWNCALLDAEQREPELAASLIRLIPGATPRDMDELRGLINEMIARKLSLFASNQRSIVSFELTSRPEGPFLAVVSTLGSSRP